MPRHRHLEPFQITGWIETDLAGRSVDQVKDELVELINQAIEADRPGGMMILFTPDGKAFEVAVSAVTLTRRKKFDADVY